jgi:hypothetical protein
MDPGLRRDDVLQDSRLPIRSTAWIALAFEKHQHSTRHPGAGRDAS